MKINNIAFIYFSPTQTTRTVAKTMQQNINIPITEFDLTDITAQNTEYTFDSNTLVVLGIPVYSGRVPKTAIKRFSALHANNTPIAFFATYGCRDYEDALIELKTITTEKGFRPVSAAAFAVQHSIVPSIGNGRPNAEDNKSIEAFICKTLEKLNALNNISQLKDLFVNGNINYRVYNTIPLMPKSNNNCTACGLCISKCPEAAILADDPRKTNKELCISCMRCVKLCPNGGRSLNKPESAMAKKLIQTSCNSDKLPEMFL